MAKFKSGETSDPRRHHRDRSRRRCARGHHHGGRTCRAVWPGAVAPVARPRRARERDARAACWSITARWAKPRRRGSRPCARPTTASSSPRRICGCAARANCWACARAACRNSASPISSAHADLLAVARDDAQLILSARSRSEIAARRGAARAALSVRRDEAVRYLRR